MNDSRRGRKRKFTREQLVLNLVWLSAEHSHVGVAQINSQGEGYPTTQSYVTEFGSVSAGLEWAGLPTRRRGRPRK
jgi:hypothetical protein